VEKDELRKDADGKKSWKTMENTSINLYCIDFFCKKIGKNFCNSLIMIFKKSIQCKLIDLININICTLKFDIIDPFTLQF